MAIRKAADVIVVGVGIFGLSCAWACLSRGMSVLVLERDTVASGASGGVVGAMSPHTPAQWDDKKQFQFEALRSAEAHWREVEAVSGLASGYGRVGRLLPLRSERERALAEKRIELARELWGNDASWNVIGSDASREWLNPDAAPFGLVSETLSARINPAAACAALATAFRAKGGEIHEDCEVLNVEPGRVETSSGPIAGNAIILAAGADGFTRFGPDGAAGEKGQAALLHCSSRPNGAPLIYHDGIYVVAQANGDVAVGSTNERIWSDLKPDDLLEDVIARARQFCPLLETATVVERWAGIRPRAPRRDPMLGRMPDMPKVFLANGAFKIGFGIAHKVGEVLADLVEDKHVDLPHSFTLAYHMRK